MRAKFRTTFRAIQHNVLRIAWRKELTVKA